MHRKMYMIALTLYLLTWRTAVAYKPLNLSDMKADSGPVPTSPISLPLTGNVHHLEHYTVKISIGNDNPPKYSYDLDVDTGSDLTWARCSNDPKYDPVEKGTGVKCSDPACKSFGDVNNCTSPNDTCRYKVRYANGDSSYGVLVRDSIPLTLANGTTVAPKLIFGCGTPGENNTDQIHGIFGLGKGELGILKQLRDMSAIMRNIVSHCFNGTGNGGGYLYLGNFPNFEDASWVPMSSDVTHYDLESVDILFDGKATGIRDLNITFDSRSTYTYLDSASYGALLVLVKNNLKTVPLTETNNVGFLCWHPYDTINGDVASYFKNVILSFMNNVQFEMPPQSYLIINEPQNVCLGILNSMEAGLGDMNLIGAISMQNKMVMYDNDNHVVGWADVETCMQQ